jgi:hypothetical protein
MVNPEVFKNTELINEKNLKKYFKCDLEGDGVSMIGEHYVCIYKNGKIFAFDSGGLFVSEKKSIILKNNIEKNTFAFYDDTGKLYCHIKLGNKKAGFNLTRSEYLRYFNNTCRTEYDTEYSGIILDQTLLEYNADDTDKKYIRFSINGNILEGRIYGKNSVTEVIGIPLTVILEVKILTQKEILIRGPFKDSFGEIYSELFCVQFGLVSTCKELISAIGEKKKTLDIEEGIVNKDSKLPVYRDTAMVIGKVNESKINKNCVIDFSDGITLLDSLTGSLIQKFELKQIQNIEIIESAIFIKIDSALFSIYLSNSVDSISNRTKTWLTKKIYNTRRIAPLIAFNSKKKEKLLVPLSIENEKNSIHAVGDKIDIPISVNLLKNTKINERGYIQTKLKNKGETLVLNEHSFTYINYNLYYSEVFAKCMDWDIAKLRYRWSELLSAYLCYHIIGDSYILFNQLQIFDNNLEKSFMLKAGLGNIKKQLINLNHIFIPHIEISGKLWASSLGFNSKSLIDIKMSNTIRSFFNKNTFGMTV